MKRKRTSRSPLAVVLALVALAAVGAGTFWYLRHGAPPPGFSPAATPATSNGAAAVPGGAPVSVSADRVDPANEGRVLAIDGRVHAAAAVRDAELGLSVDALVLLRRVEMLQWREQCSPADCSYDLAWSAEPVDSSAFRMRKGHENPGRFPFASKRMAAESLRLGGFDVDPSLIETSTPIAYPVQPSQLPPNLAATFRGQDGALYSGADPARGSAGDLRVSYQVVPAGERRLTAIQRGHRLLAATRAAASDGRGKN